MTERLMLDIETLGRERGAAIASIGAIQFDPDGLGEEFYVSVSPADCQAHGLDVEVDTVSWWVNQPETAREELFGGRDLQSALEEFAEFADGVDEVWAKSPSFDCAILDEAGERVGVPLPWRYWQERDVRTIMDLPFAEELPDDGQDHHALDDAREQARNVAAALKEVYDDE